MLAGPPASGKTNFVILASCSQAKKGNKVIFIDTEGGFSVERLKQIDSKYEEILKNIIILKPTNFDEQKRAITSKEFHVPEEPGEFTCGLKKQLNAAHRRRVDRAPTQIGLRAGGGEALTFFADAANFAFQRFAAQLLAKVFGEHVLPVVAWVQAQLAGAFVWRVGGNVAAKVVFEDLAQQWHDLGAHAQEQVFMFQRAWQA